MKKILYMIAAVAAIVLASSSVRAVDLSGLPPELAEKLDILLATRFPPIVESVTIEPESPAADESVKVTAVVQNDGKVTDDETIDVFVQFTTDGGETWQEVDMDQESDEKTWTTEIPGQPSGTEVLYAIRARDTSTNITTDLPCQVENLPYEGYAEKTCANSDDIQANCQNLMPIGCMVALSHDDDPLDDEDNLIPKYFDLLDPRVGYNDEYLFFDLVTEAKQGPGSASPMDMRMYAVAIANPDRGTKGTDLDALITQGVVVVNAPLATITGGLVKPCFVGFLKGSDFIQDDTSVTCKTSGLRLYLRVKRSVIGDNPSGQLTVIPLNGSISSISPVAGSVYDYTHFTTLNFQSRKYTVQ